MRSEYTGLGDPARHATRDSVVVSLNSSSLEYKVPLIHQLKGRTTDVSLEMSFRSQYLAPGGKFGNFWALNVDHMLVLEFYDQVAQECGSPCAGSPPKALDYRKLLNSQQLFKEYQGGRVMNWTNRDAIEGIHAFLGQGIIQGLLTFNLCDCKMYKPDPVENTGAYVTHPASSQHGNVEGTSFDPPRMGDPLQDRIGFSDFVAPPGDFRTILPACGGFALREADGTIHEFDRFRWRRESVICVVDVDGISTPPTAGDPGVQAVRIQAVALKRAVISPNGDRIDYSYDAYNRLTALVDNYGRQVHFEYDDDAGAPWRVRRIFENAEDGTTAIRETVFTYEDADSQVNTRWDTHLKSITSRDLSLAADQDRVWSFDYVTHDTEPRNMLRPGMERRVYIDHVWIHAPGDPQGSAQVHAHLVNHPAGSDDPPWYQDMRVVDLTLGYPTQVDINGDGQTETLSPEGTTTYVWNLGKCQQYSTVTVTDPRGNATHHTFDWMGNEIERTVDYNDHDYSQGGDGTPIFTQATTYFQYYGDYPINANDLTAPTSLLKLETRPNGEQLSYRYQATVDDDLGKSHYNRVEHSDLGELPRDTFQQGNLLQKAHISSLDATQIVEKSTYEPLFNQIRTTVDPRGIVSPPDAELEASYSTTNFFDYQEGLHRYRPVAWWTSRRIDDSSIVNDTSIKGDLNLDGLTSQVYGDVIETIHPLVTDGTLPYAKTERFAFNAAGQEVYAIDGEGYVHTREYYPFNDPDGNGTLTPGLPSGITREVFGGGYLSREIVDDHNIADPGTHGVELLTQYGYDPLGHQVWKRDPRDILSVTLYNRLNLKTVEARGDIDLAAQAVGSAPVYQKTLFTYDLNDNLTIAQDHNDDPQTATGSESAGWVTTRLFYDALNELCGERKERVKPGESSHTSLTTYLERDVNGNVTRTVTPQGRVTSFTYDERNLVHTKRKHVTIDTTPFDGSSFSNDDLLLSFRHDENGNLTGIYTRNADGSNAATTIDYDGFSRRIGLADPLGNRTEQAFDAASNITAVIKKGARDQTDTDLTQELSHVDYAYDQLSRVYQVDKKYFRWTKNGTTWTKENLGEPTHLGSVYQYLTYDRRDLTVVEQDDKGRTTTVQFDGAGREIRRTLPLVSGYSTSNDTTKDYDGNGNVVEVNQHEVGKQGSTEVTNHFETRNEYDVLDRNTKVTHQPGDALEVVTRSQYNSLGHKTWDWNGNGVGTQHLYDTQGLEWRTQAGYTDANPSIGAMLGEGNPDGFIVVERTFDLDGKTTTQTDDDGDTTSFDFDGMGRQWKLTYHDSSYETVSFFRDNTIDHERRYAKDPTHAEIDNVGYTYDAAKRKTAATVTLPGGSPLLGVTSEQFGYDGLSRVTYAKAVAKAYTPTGSTFESNVAKVYDSLDNVSQDGQHLVRHDATSDAEIFGDAAHPQVVARTLDGLGNRTKVTAPEYERNYAFDELNRITGVTQPSVGSLFQLSWVGSGHRVDTITYGNGLKCEIGPSGYDALKRPIDIKHNAGGAWYSEFKYTYDKENNRLSEEKVHDHTDCHKFEYDGGNRLRTFKQGTFNFEALAEDYNLDGAGDWRKHTIGGTERANTTTSLHEYQTSFDDDPAQGGDQGTSVAYDDRGDLITWGTKELKYDVRGRVVGCRNTTTNAKSNFVYDAEGRRVFGGSKYYVYELEREIKQDTYPALSPTLFVTYGTGPDEILEIERDGSKFYLHRDALGSTVAVSRQNQALADRIDYTPYGVPTITSYGGGSSNPYLFAGRRRDTETGLYHMRARSYVPEMGRFASRDPIGLWGDFGNWGNPYSYVGNRPLAGADPSATLAAPHNACEDGKQYQKSQREKSAKEAAAARDETRKAVDQYNSDLQTGVMQASIVGQLEGPAVGAAYAQAYVNQTFGDAAAQDGVGPLRVDKSGGVVPAGGSGINGNGGIFSRTGDSVDHNGAIDEDFASQLGLVMAVNGVGQIASAGLRGLLSTSETGVAESTEGAVGGKIAGYTNHGIEQAIARDGGKGVDPKAILDAVRSPTTVVAQTDGTTKCVGENATVVLNSEGKVVTTWGKPRNPGTKQ
ncbi:MAG: RHS repeat-associated core domain-containing protein [Planctomycetota bacterium]